LLNDSRQFGTLRMSTWVNDNSAKYYTVSKFINVVVYDNARFHKYMVLLECCTDDDQS